MKSSWEKILAWCKSLTIREIWLGTIVIAIVSTAGYGFYNLAQPDADRFDPASLFGKNKNPQSRQSASTPTETPSSQNEVSKTTATPTSSATHQSDQSGNGSGESSSNNSSQSGGGSSGNGSGNGSSSGLTSCGSNYSFFTSSPLNQGDFVGLVPLGNLNPSGHVFPTDHIYFYLTNPAIRYGLYGPGEATVTQISASEHIEDGFTDYSIYFQPCNELKAYFLHVSSLADKLSSALSVPYQWDSTYSTGGKTYRNYGKNVSVSISAGEQIGQAGGNSGQNALDMGTYDTRATLSFANYSRWSQMSDRIHTVCPIDYYSSDLKNTLYARFGDYDGNPRRTIVPICGTIAQDVAETAQGAWFAKGTTSWQGEDPHLALAHSNVNPNIAVFSVGTSMSASGLNVGVYEFYPQGSGLVNRDFDDVRSDGNIYCYEMDGQGWVEGNITILVQLPNSTTLKIERGGASSCGSGPWSFSGNASEFER